MQPVVLIVDDDPNIRDSYRRQLRNSDFRLLLAESGHQALQVMKRERIDVLVTDYMMPGLTGVELLSLAHRYFPGTIGLLVTGAPDLEGAIRCINDGHVFKYFVKPCSPLQLTVGIHAALAEERRTEGYNAVSDRAAALNDVLALESEYPGITNVVRDDEGAILLFDL